MTINQGKLFVFAAPSGAGKTSLVKALTENNHDLTVSISHTTRKRRPDEVHGVNYYFVSQVQFDEIKENHGFVESAEVFGKSYGTSYEEVNRILNSGKHLILEIDWQGAQQIRQTMPTSSSIFILPPSTQALRDRLQNRGQDDAATIKNRMSEAISEMSHFSEFDHLIINDNFKVALQQIEEITLKDSGKYKIDSQSTLYKNLLADLLAV